MPCYQYEARLVHSLRQLKPRLVGLQRMVLKAMKHEEELRTSHPKEARDAWELLSCHKAYLAELAAALLGVRIRCEAFEPAKLSADGVVDVARLLLQALGHVQQAREEERFREDAMSSFPSRPRELGNST